MAVVGLAAVGVASDVAEALLADEDARALPTQLAALGLPAVLVAGDVAAAVLRAAASDLATGTGAPAIRVAGGDAGAIALGAPAFLLAMAHRSWQLNANDDVQDDVEDAAIRRLAAADEASDSHDLATAGEDDVLTEEGA